MQKKKGTKRLKGLLALILSVGMMAGSVPVSADAVIQTATSTPNGQIWVGNNKETTYNKLTDAVAAAAEGSTIHVSGTFDADRINETTVKKNITLDVAGDTMMTGNGSAKGITLASGAKLECSDGVTLTMSNFGMALDVQKGAEVTDGKYDFENNQDTTHGIHIAGNVKGSVNQDSVRLTANDKAETNFYDGTATFEKATIDVTSQTWTWMDGKALNLNSATMILSGFGQGFYIDGGSIENSLLRMKAPGNRDFWGISFPYGRTGMTFQGKATTVENSTVEVDYGSNAGISIGLSSSTEKMSFVNSVLNLKNDGTGGLNVNTGNVILDNTELTGDGKNTALFGAQENNGNIAFTNGSYINIPANGKANGGGQGTKNFVVTSGSFEPNGTYNNPVNGNDNGNDSLELVTLVNSDVDQFQVLNANGQYYSYTVKNISSDGQKHVLVPTATVTFELNSDAATFADDTKSPKEEKTIRGNKLSMVKDSTVPENPTNSNATFLGWYYKDSNNNEIEFNDESVVDQDMTVYAKWSTQNVPEKSPREQNKTPNNSSKSNTAETTENITFSDNLFGDILIGNDSEDKSVHKVIAGENLNYIGRLNVKPVKDRIEDLKSAYAGDSNTITTQNIKSTFTTTVTIPSGLEVSENPTATLTDNDLFYISDVKKSGNNITITMSLKKEYKKFSALYNDVKNVPDDLYVTLNGVYVSDKAEANSRYTVIGTVKGTFKGSATTAAGTTRNYDFTWTGVQDANGKDCTQQSDSTAIQYTVQVLPWIESNENLLGDILIGDDTEHTTVHEVKAGEDLSYIGRLNVKTIKDKIDALKQAYGGNSDTITTGDIESTFSTKVTVPDGLKVSDKPTATLTNNDLFEISGVEKNGKNIVITMKLNKSYEKFSDLYNDVMSVPDSLDVTLDGVSVSKDAKAGEQYTVIGVLDGLFTGKATSQYGSAQAYKFTWTGVQDPDGKDYTQAANDNDTIQYTIQVKKTSTVKPTDTPTPTPTNTPAVVPTEPAEPTKSVTVNDPPISKTIAGDKPAKDSEFRFTMKADDPSYPMPEGSENGVKTVKHTGAGSIEFGNITFTEPGTYTYTLSEQNDQIPGYQFDRSVYKVTYVVSEDQNGNLTSTRTITRDGKETEDIAFANHYTSTGKKPTTTPTEPSKPVTPTTKPTAAPTTKPSVTPTKGAASTTREATSSFGTARTSTVTNTPSTSVSATDKASSPATGDTFHGAAWLTVLLVAVAAIAGSLMYRKKQK